ncbi:MAG: outer membrane protein assembly factor BamB family protein [Thermoguttaceae bacterium]
MARETGVMLGGIVFLAASWALALDWPQWRGPERAGRVSGFVAPQTWPKQLAQKWRTTVGAGDSTPALVDDRLYVFSRLGDQEVLLCLSAADGKELWRNAYPVEAISGPDARAHSGPRSSPAVAEGKVVTLGVTGVVSCVDAQTGKLLWRNDQYKAVPQYHTAMSPIIVDGMAILHLGGQGEGAMVAFDLATGQPKWKWTGEAPMYASPVLMTVEGTKQIVTLTEKSVVGLAAADGRLLWQVPFAPTGRLVYNAATPIVDGQTVIFTGSGRGTRAVRIEKQGDDFVVKPLWSNPQLATQFNSPVLKDGLLYGLSERGMLYCINAKTGQTAWLDTNRLSGFGAILDAGSVLLVLPEKAGLIAFKPSDKGFEQLARIEVANTPVYAHPVVSGNRIFVRDRDAVTLWAIQ